MIRTFLRPLSPRNEAKPTVALEQSKEARELAGLPCHPNPPMTLLRRSYWRIEPLPQCTYPSLVPKGGKIAWGAPYCCPQSSQATSVAPTL